MNLNRCLHAAAAAAIAATFGPSLRADYPIASHRHLADPAAFVHEGRVYVYCSNDDDSPVDGGYEMRSLVCVSSTDLKNWTDHGEVVRVPDRASWAKYTWAPAVIARNGRFYLYFANGGSGIGVVTSASPTGPFTSPTTGTLHAKFGYIVNAATPGATGPNIWLFDPAVFLDDDGQAYLFFGGNGESNLRVIRLNADMLSVNGAALTLTAPNFFEAAWLHKRDGLYYLSYSTNPSNGMRIDYLTSSSPTEGFTYRGVVAGQPPSNSNNNHAAIFAFRGGWYHVYHNRFVATQAGIPTTYRRNLGLESLTYEADGTIRQIAYTTDGVTQLAPVDPYTPVEAETLSAQSGIETEPCSEGGLNLAYVEHGDWVKISGVDFGAGGAATFHARVASGGAGGGGAIELRLGHPTTGALLGTCVVPATGGWQGWTTRSCAVAGATGTHDLYLCFTGGSGYLLNVNWWRFAR